MGSGACRVLNDRYENIHSPNLTYKDVKLILKYPPLACAGLMKSKAGISTMYI